MDAAVPQHLLRDAPISSWVGAIPWLLYEQTSARLNVRKNFLSERMVKHWNRLPGKVMNPLSLQVFKKSVDVALRTVV